MQNIISAWGRGLAVAFVFAGMAGCEKTVESTIAQTQVTSTTFEFMTWYLEPAADVLWDNAGYVLTVDGEEDLQPVDQAGWDRVRDAATVVAEGGNLMVMPGYLVDEPDWKDYAAGVTAAALSAREAAQAQIMGSDQIQSQGQFLGSMARTRERRPVKLLFTDQYRYCLGGLSSCSKVASCSIGVTR